MREVINEISLYGIDPKRRLRLDVFSDGLQLYTLEIDPEETWQPIEFPEALKVWDPESKKAYIYFVENGNLYRYHQYIRAIPKDLLKKRNQDKRTKFFSSFNGFSTEDEQGKKITLGQKIDIFNIHDKSWYPTSFKDFSSKTFIRRPNALPHKLEVPNQPDTTTSCENNAQKSVSWIQQRNDPPKFGEAITEPQFPEKTKARMNWQLDYITTLCLEFKSRTESKEDYLSLLQILFGENVSEKQKKSPLLKDVVEARARITNVMSLLRDHIEDSVRITNFNGMAKLYILNRIAQEYGSVAGLNEKDALPFHISVRRLPQPEFDKDNLEHDRAWRIYKRIRDNSSYVNINLVVGILFRLRPNTLPFNEYNYAADWLEADEGIASKVTKKCLHLIIHSLYPGIASTHLNPLVETLNNLMNTGFNAPDMDEIASMYPEAFAILNEDFSLTLLEKKKLLSPNRLFIIAQTNEVFALKLLNYEKHKINLSIYHLYMLSKKYRDFSLSLLANDEILLFSDTQLFELTKQETFALKLLNNPAALSKLSGKQFIKIFETHESVSQALHENPTALSGLSGDQLYKLAKHKGFSSKLLDNEKLISNLSGDQLYKLAKDKSFSLKFLDNEKALSNLSGDQLCKLGGHEAFALKLITNQETLSRLSSDQLISIANTHESASMCLLNHLEVLTKLSGDQLYSLSIANSAFLEKIISLTNFIDTLSIDQLSGLALVHEASAMHLFDIPNAILNLNTFRLNRISKAHTTFVEKLMKLPDLINKLSHNQLASIAKAHEGFSSYFLDEKKLLKLSVDQLRGITNAHPSFASNLIVRPDLLNALSNVQLSNIAKENKIFALNLINNDNLISKLSQDDLSIIALYHESFALSLINKMDLISKLSVRDLVYIGNMHCRFWPEYLLLSGGLLSTCDRSEALFLSSNRQFTNELLSTKTILDKELTSYQSGVFEKIKQRIHFALTIYNLNTYIQSDTRATLDKIIISRTCFETISRSQNKKELLKALQTEQERMFKALSFQKSISRIFQNPPHLQQLSQCIQAINHFTLADMEALPDQSYQT